MDQGDLLDDILGDRSDSTDGSVCGHTDAGDSVGDDAMDESALVPETAVASPTTKIVFLGDEKHTHDRTTFQRSPGLCRPL